jgi:arylsulfatase A
MKTPIIPALILVITTSVSLTAAGEVSGDIKPNILLILADDLGYGDVQCLGGDRSKIATPNLDRLAREGMIFTEAHSSSSVCTPTRYGILTGRYNWRSRLQSGVLDDYSPPLIDRDRLTLPGLLKQYGYTTACMGKWHLGFTVDAKGQKGEGAPLGARTPDGPLTRGFDHFYGFHHARMMKSLFEDDRVTEIIQPIDMLPKLTQHAVEYIRARAGTEQPFFLYLALNSPHTPIVPTAEWQGKSGLNRYADFVMQTDASVGEVLEALDQTGLAKNTLVIFTSDNGCSPAAKVDELESKGHYPSELRRGYKADVWDGGHRVPFIVRWPGKVRAGSRSDQLVCLTDIMATCAEILGTKLPPNAGEDSISILPVLLGADTGPVREAVVHHSIRGNFAIRQGQWKLILCPDSGGWSRGTITDAPCQLYDMSKDVGERTNEYNRHPEIVSRLLKLLEYYVAEGRSTPGPAQKNDVPIDIWKRTSSNSQEPEA